MSSSYLFAIGNCQWQFNRSCFSFSSPNKTECDSLCMLVHIISLVFRESHFSVFLTAFDIKSFEHPEMPFIAPPPFVCSAVATVIFLDYFSLHDVFSALWLYWGAVFVNLLCCCISSNVCDILLNARSVVRMLIPCMTLWLAICLFQLGKKWCDFLTAHMVMA